MTSNQQTRIELVSRSVNFPLNSKLDKPYQHLFLLYTVEGETPVSVSAEPKNGNYLGGNIYVKVENYKDGVRNVDFEACRKSQCSHTIQAQGSKELIQQKWTKILQRTEEINTAQIPYDIALVCEKFLDPLGLLNQKLKENGVVVKKHACNTRNSNTVVKDLLKNADIEANIDISPEDIPGYGSELGVGKKQNEETANRNSQSQFDFDTEEYQKYFTEDYLKKLQEQTANIIDRAVEAQRQMKKEGVVIPPSTGNYMQDALDIAAYSNEILSRAGLLGENEEGKDEL